MFKSPPRIGWAISLLMQCFPVPIDLNISRIPMVTADGRRASLGHSSPPSGSRFWPIPLVSAPGGRPISVESNYRAGTGEKD